jgi:hypothetical protein
MASEAKVLEALEKAFDYRGDVTITRRDGTSIEGYTLDRRGPGPTLADSYVRLFPKDTDQKIAVPYSDVGALHFTSRDTAAGKAGRPG